MNGNHVRENKNKQMLNQCWFISSSNDV